MFSVAGQELALSLCDGTTAMVEEYRQDTTHCELVIILLTKYLYLEMGDAFMHICLFSVQYGPQF